MEEYVSVNWQSFDLAGGVFTGRIIYYDFCAMILLIILLVTLYIRKITGGHVAKYFLVLIVIQIITCVADIWGNSLDNSGQGDYKLKYTVNTIYFTFHALIMPFFTYYLIALTDTWHIVKRSPLMKIVLFLPVTADEIMVITNDFTKAIFYLDSQERYVRGDYFKLLYVTAMIYFVFFVVHLIRFRKSLDRISLSSILLLSFISIGMVLVQYFHPEYQIEMFCNALGLLVVSMVVQRPEDTIDSDTKLYKLQKYMNTMKHAYQNKKNLKIIQVNITNYQTLRDMIGYDGMVELVVKTTSRLGAVDVKHKLHSDMYNLGAGKLRLVIEEKDFKKVNAAAGEINEKLKKEIPLIYGNVFIVANVCVVSIPEDISNLDSLMYFGDDLTTFPYSGEVLYASEIYRKRHYDLMRDIDAIIENALVEHKFEVFYQPIYSVKEKRFKSAEALLRLNDKKYGFIPPNIFIAAAEKNGAIHRLGTYVLEEVCRFIASDIFKELNVEYIEVNLSVAQCMQKDLADDVLKVLEKYDVKPSQINLEVTETAVSYSHQTMMNNLKKLNDSGVLLSLDDFGTGYSNMYRIALLPLSIVKLDRSLVNAENTPNMQIVIDDTIKMIKDMKMEIVVEGIETEELVNKFSDLQCEYIQGYYYSKPIPKDDFTEFIMST